MDSLAARSPPELLNLIESILSKKKGREVPIMVNEPTGQMGGEGRAKDVRTDRWLSLCPPRFSGRLLQDNLCEELGG